MNVQPEARLGQHVYQNVQRLRFCVKGVVFDEQGFDVVEGVGTVRQHLSLRAFDIEFKEIDLVVQVVFETNGLNYMVGSVAFSGQPATVGAVAGEVELRFTIPDGAIDELDVVIAESFQVRLEKLEDLLVSLKCGDDTARIKTLEIDHTKTDVRSAIENERPIGPGVEAIDLLVKDFSIRKDEGGRIGNHKRLAEETGGCCLVTWDRFELLQMAVVRIDDALSPVN